jgi:RNA polymerase sigma-70 factor (ECF subfamily)
VLYANSARSRTCEAEWTALVQAIAGGDQLALQILYGRIHRLVFTLAVRIVRSRETAEEITVDVFHDVWKRASTYDASGGTVVGWIMNQARSRALDRLRFEQRKKRTPAHSSATLDAITESTSEESLEAGDRQQLLRHALALLTTAEREAIEAAFFSEYSYQETAARLNQPVGTIKTRIRSGLAKLRSSLAGEEP